MEDMCMRNIFEHPKSWPEIGFLGYYLETFLTFNAQNCMTILRNMYVVKKCSTVRNA